jgi:hypothetical protein
MKQFANRILALGLLGVSVLLLSAQASSQPLAAFASAGAKSSAGVTKAAPPTAEKCGALLKQPDGSFNTVVFASLKVIELTQHNREFILPKDVPDSLASIQCVRDSIIPLANDYKVLLSGLPLYLLVPHGRMAVLELSNGKASYRIVKGDFSESEIAAIQQFLNSVQQYF